MYNGTVARCVKYSGSLQIEKLRGRKRETKGGVDSHNHSVKAREGVEPVIVRSSVPVHYTTHLSNSSGFCYLGMVFQ
jgi:hypothetical protein